MHFNIEDLVIDHDRYLAHLGDATDETLEEHSQLTYDYYKKISAENGIDKKVLNIIRNVFESYESQYSNLVDYVHFLFEKAIYLHDIGKINRDFQIDKMKNNNFSGISGGMSKHSIISSLIYIDDILADLDRREFSRKEKKLLYPFISSFSYIISRHHGYLKNLNEYCEAILDILDKIKLEPERIDGYKNLKRLTEYNEEKLEVIIMSSAKFTKENSIEFFILTKLLYSSIVACDFYATSHFINKSPIDTFGYVANKDEFCSKYFKNNLINSIINYKFEDYIKSINCLRSRMFHSAKDKFLNNLDKNIFYLEAPTGSGKTLTSINLAVEGLLNSNNINRIYYVFPFNTLVDQTEKVLSSVFDEDNIAVVNSISPIKINENNDYDKSYLDRIFLNYNITLTSHVRFFGILFGVGRESNLPLISLANSVVIIDEIQSYKIMIWKELMIMLEKYAELLNIKFIIMSATLPKLSVLTGNSSYVDLIEDKSTYFENDFFKKRVNLNFDLLEKGKIDYGMLLNHLKSNVVENNLGRVLIEFIDKVSAREFYKAIKESYDFREYEVVELTGDDNQLFREDIISRLKQKDHHENFTWSNVIVVATQVIEAGVDIDMNIGYKDISLIDSEEQFVGRINRSCMRKDCIVYFFDCFNAKDIYKNDVRIEYDVNQIKYRTYFAKKKFEEYFKDVLLRVNEEKDRNNNNSIEIFYDNIRKSDYIEVYKNLRLIDKKNFTIFIPMELNYQGKKFDGNIIWNRYISLLNNTAFSYTKKQIELSKINRELSYFTFSVGVEPLTYSDIIGDLYFLEDGVKYIEEGKFNRKLYNEINLGKKTDYDQMIM